MPALNGTGPRGMGPRTGRGFGYCGYSRGVARRPLARPTVSDRDYLKMLKEEEEYILEYLEELRAEIKDFGKGPVAK